MRWSRGFHRVFIILAVLWVLSAAHVTVLGRLTSTREQISRLKTSIANGQREQAQESDTIVPPPDIPPNAIVYVDSKGGVLPSPPVGFVLDTLPSKKYVNVPNLGVIEFPGDMSDGEIRQALREELPKRGIKPDIFDRIAIEEAAKNRSLSRRQSQLAALSHEAVYHIQLLRAFSASSIQRTLTILLLPPAALYAAIALLVLIFRWVLAGFRADRSAG